MKRGAAVTESFPPVITRLIGVTILLGIVLLVCAFIGISVGPSGVDFAQTLAALTGKVDTSSMSWTIIWQVRLPRVALAAAVGATLALGGLVFQALLRNTLAEPYILGVSGGSAVGAILGIIAGFSNFPGIALTSFIGSMGILALVLALAAGRSILNKDSLLLGGVMMNAFCGAVIMFLISLTKTSQMHHILFWLMGDLSMFTQERMPVLLAVIPCFILILILARPMNLLLMGEEAAAASGINVNLVSMVLLIATSLMVSIVVCQSGLVGFVGLVVPHVLRMMLGPDHRLLVPACLLGGGSYLIFCDLLARTLPSQGEMPVGIITAMIGAPLFIFLLWRAKR
ncbi:MAG: iron ABC transporter permease [Proteobacteria bacterium]|nr:iron ABC transporter permease [Pseudomonadota bacterium]